MKFRILIFCILPFFLLSCGENSALKEETYYFEETHRAWIPDYDQNFQFVVSDTNGISESFMLDQDETYFTKSWGSFLGINTDMTHTEYHYQAYSSSYGNRFTISLTAGWPPYGDEIFVTMNDVEFAYDLKKERVSRVYSEFGSKSLLMTEDGYEENETIHSTVTILSNTSIGSNEYNEVLQFVFLDYAEEQKPLTIKEIYIAKDCGLVKYVYNNGISFSR